MIKHTHTGIKFTAETSLHEHAAHTYGFLLNTDDRRGIWWTWEDFADLMRQYSSHPTTHLIASEIAS